MLTQPMAYLFQFGGKGNRHYVFEATVLESDTPQPNNEISDCKWFSFDETDRSTISVATMGILECIQSAACLSIAASSLRRKPPKKSALSDLTIIGHAAVRAG
jgi:hypothetical protein